MEDLKLKRKVFAMYMGQRVFFKNIAPKVAVELTESVLFRMTSIPTVLARATLILRDLQTLTLEEIMELCKKFFPVEFGDYRFSKWKLEYQKENSQFWKAADLKNDKSDEYFTIDLIDGHIYVYRRSEEGSLDKEIERSSHNNEWQWYLEKGFALPFLPDNKNPIQLGFAISEQDYKI